MDERCIGAPLKSRIIALADIIMQRFNDYYGRLWIADRDREARSCPNRARIVQLQRKRSGDPLNGGARVHESRKKNPRDKVCAYKPGHKYLDSRVISIDGPRRGDIFRAVTASASRAIFLPPRKRNDRRCDAARNSRGRRRGGERARRRRIR